MQTLRRAQGRTPLLLQVPRLVKPHRPILTRDWGLSDSAKGSGGREIVSEPPRCAGDGSKANSEGGVRFGEKFGPTGAERGL